MKGGKGRESQIKVRKDGERRGMCVGGEEINRADGREEKKKCERRKIKGEEGWKEGGEK